MGFKYLKGNCPICLGGRKDCRLEETKQLYFCRVDISEIATNYFFCGTDSLGFNLWRLEAPKNKTPHNPVSKKVKEKRLPHVDNLTNTRRHIYYSNLLTQLVLTPEDRDLLLKRGLTLETIECNGYRSIDKNQKLLEKLNSDLPGISRDGLQIESKYSGILCPVRDCFKNIVGYQLRLNDDVEADAGKYRWARSYRSCKYQNGEMPLNVAISKNSPVIGLCEGILKSQIASAQHNISFIGASGGLFGSSKETLKNSLRTLKLAHDTDEVVLFPDAKCLINKNIRNQMKIAIKLVLKWGYRCSVAFWGQFWGDNLKDIDEVECITKIISGELFLNLENKPEKIYSTNSKVLLSNITRHSRILKPQQYRTLFEEKNTPDTKKYYQGCLPKYKDTNSRLPHYIVDRTTRDLFYYEAVKKGWWRILDLSPTGSGKSFVVADLKITNFSSYNKDAKLVYLLRQSRNPTIAGIEGKFRQLPTRHQGLAVSEKLTPLGNKVYIRPTKDKPAETQSNCHWANHFTTLSNKSFEYNLCNICRYKENCKSFEGDGFGYLSECETIKQYIYFRGNPQGLSLGVANKHSIAIVDEYSQTLPILQLWKCNGVEFAKYMSKLKAWFPEIYYKFENVLEFMLGSLMGGCETKYGYNTKYLKNLVQQADPDFINIVLDFKDLYEYKLLGEFKNNLKNSIEVGELDVLPSKIILKLLLILANVMSGSIDLKYDSLEVWARNDRLINILSEFKSVIYQDATGSVEDLATLLDVPMESIITCTTQESGITDNLTITHIWDFGLKGNKRNEELQNRVQALTTKLINIYGKDNVGIIDWKKYLTNNPHPHKLSHLSDARGSNNFQDKKVVIALGVPFCNLGALRCEYEVLSGDILNIEDDNVNFAKFINQQVISDIIQEIGRLRAANRPLEQLKFYFVGDIDSKFLIDRGYKVEIIPTVAIAPELMTPRQQLRFNIFEAYRTLRKDLSHRPKQKDVASYLNISRQRVARICNKFGNWYNFIMLLDGLLGYQELSKEKLRVALKYFHPNLEIDPQDLILEDNLVAVYNTLKLLPIDVQETFVEYLEGLGIELDYQFQVSSVL